MNSNNQRAMSFYPNNKKPINHNLINKSVANNNVNNYNNIFNNVQEPINYVDNNINENVELALLTINLSYSKFKLMDKNHLEQYINSVSFSSSENRKFIISHNILSRELDRINNKIIKQDFIDNSISNKNTQANNTFYNIIDSNGINNFDNGINNFDNGINNFDNEINKFDTTNTNNKSYLEPDEFNLNIPSTNTNIYVGNIEPILKQPQRKNLDALTYNGNMNNQISAPRILNHMPGISFNPISQQKYNQQSNQQLNPGLKVNSNRGQSRANLDIGGPVENYIKIN